jgi:hypothetical protein
MKHPRAVLRASQSVLACAALLLALGARAADARFSERLTPEERSACGIAKLTAAESATLDGLVSHDVTSAHQGGVTGFASAFCARHSAQERASAGIDRLSEPERAAIDSLVARALALGPPPMQGFAYSPPAKPAPQPVEKVVSDISRTQVHGDVSLTVGGGGHGQNFYGTSADVFVTDPTGKFTVGVGVEEFRGRGLLGLYGLGGPLCPVYSGRPLLGDW